MDYVNTTIPVLASLLFVVLAGPNTLEAQTGEARAIGPRTSHQYGELTQTLNSGMAETLNKGFNLPRDVVLTSDQCGAENAFYRYRAGEGASITLCAELIDDVVREFRGNNLSQAELGEAVSGTLAFVLLHEVGHALIHQLQLPVLGREEDAVDELATLLLSSRPSYAIYAANYWMETDNPGDIRALKGFFRVLNDLSSVNSNSFADEHALDKQRFYNIICWTYGAAPQSRQDLTGVLPADRAQRCPREYRQKKRSWEELLEPHTKQPIAGSLGPAPSRSGNAATDQSGAVGRSSPVDSPNRSTTNLSTSYEVQIGDLGALLLSDFIDGSREFEHPVVVTYEPDPGTIDVEIFGRDVPSTTARESVTEHWSFIQDRFLPYVSRRFDTELTQNDFRIIYYRPGDQQQPEVVTAWIQGSFREL